MLQLDDLTDRSVPAPTSSPADAVSHPGDPGWAELMQLAADFPLESLSFGLGAASQPPTLIALPEPRGVAYDQANVLVDGAGDGPSIGLGAGMALTAD